MPDPILKFEHMQKLTPLLLYMCRPAKSQPQEAPPLPLPDRGESGELEAQQEAQLEAQVEAQLLEWQQLEARLQREVELKEQKKKLLGKLAGTPGVKCSKQADAAVHAKVGSAAMYNELGSSAAAPDKPTLTAEERKKVQQIVGAAITRIPLPAEARQMLQAAMQAAQAEKAAQVAQQEQLLMQAAQLKLELDASVAECARQKELAARSQEEVNRMVSSTVRLTPAQLERAKAKELGLEKEVAALLLRARAAEEKSRQQKEGAAELRGRLEEAGRQNAALQQKLEEVGRAKPPLAAEANRVPEERLRQEVSDLRQQLEKAKRARHEVSTQDVTLKQQLEKAKKAGQEAQKQDATLRRELEDAKRAGEEARKKGVALQRQSEEAKRATEEARKRDVALRRDLEEARRAMEEVSKSHGIALQRQSEEAKGAVEETRKQEIVLKQELEYTKWAMEEAQKQGVALKQQLGDAQQAMEEASEKGIALMQQSEEAKRVMEEASKQEITLRQQLRGAERELHALSDQCDLLTWEAHAVVQQGQQRDAALHGALEEVQVLSARCDVLTREAAEAVQREQRREAEMYEAVQRREWELLGQVQALTAQCNHLNWEAWASAQQLRQQGEQSQQDMQALRAHYQALEEEVVTLRQQAAAGAEDGQLQRQKVWNLRQRLVREGWRSAALEQALQEAACRQDAAPLVQRDVILGQWDALLNQWGAPPQGQELPMDVDSQLVLLDRQKEAGGGDGWGGRPDDTLLGQQQLLGSDLLAAEATLMESGLLHEHLLEEQQQDLALLGAGQQVEATRQLLARMTVGCQTMSMVSAGSEEEETVSAEASDWESHNGDPIKQLLNADMRE